VIASEKVTVSPARAQVRVHAVELVTLDRFNGQKASVPPRQPGKKEAEGRETL